MSIGNFALVLIPFSHDRSPCMYGEGGQPIGCEVLQPMYVSDTFFRSFRLYGVEAQVEAAQSGRDSGGSLVVNVLYGAVPFLFATSQTKVCG